MQPDFRIIPNAVYICSQIFFCLNDIHVFGKQRSVNTQKVVFNTELMKSSLPRRTS